MYDFNLEVEIKREGERERQKEREMRERGERGREREIQAKTAIKIYRTFPPYTEFYTRTFAHYSISRVGVL